MRLGRIAQNDWDVLAVLSDRDECVLDQLEALEAEMATHVEAIYKMLFNRVPDAGPSPQAVGRYGSSPLGDGLFELRKGPKKGAKVRVVWFYGVPPHVKTIICTDAFKKRDKTPTTHRERALDLLTTYRASPTDVTIVDLMED